MAKENISFDEIIKNKEYRERVIKYFRLPILLSASYEKFVEDMKFIEERDFSYYMEIVTAVEHDFNALREEQNTDTPDFTMENVIQEIADEIEVTDAWREFISEDNSDVLDDYKGITSTHGFYAKENDGKLYLSVDLKTANWQSLQTITGIKESYEDYIVKFSDKKILPLSKSFRTKVTSLLNAKKIMDYNKKLLKENYQDVLTLLDNECGTSLSGREPIAFYADEVIFELTNDEFDVLSEDQSRLERLAKETTAIQVHITTFKMKWLNFGKACARIANDGTYELKNLGKPGEMIYSRVLADTEVKSIHFEGINLKRLKLTEEEYIDEMRRINREITKEF